MQFTGRAISERQRRTVLPLCAASKVRVFYWVELFVTALAVFCIAAVCLVVIGRRVPVAGWVRNALRDRRQTVQQVAPDLEMRKPDNDRRKNA